MGVMSASEVALVPPETIDVSSRSDVIMSIKPLHMDNIAKRLKNHEYRKYLLPSTVRRIWFYTSAPIQEVRYVASISQGKQPGQIPEDGGIGNEEFNAGKKASKFGYEIIQLWELCAPLSLDELKAERFLKGPPQKYCWLSPAMYEHFPLAEQRPLFTTGKA